MTDISVIIPTYNAGEQLQELLGKIEGQDITSEIVVIDSGSDDETVSIAERKSDILVKISNDEFHHSRTRNLGARVATGELLVFTVQDAMPQNDQWLSTLTDPIRSQDFDIVYGNQSAHKSAKPPDEFFYSYMYPSSDESIQSGEQPPESEFYLDNVYVSDVNVAMRRDTWEQVQFDPEISFSEDKDFAYRALSEGFDIKYQPEAVLNHSHDYALSDLMHRRYQDGKAFARIASREPTNFTSDGVEYFISEIRHLVKSGNMPWIPYVLLYDFVHYLSFILGLYGKYLPRYIDTYMCRGS